MEMFQEFYSDVYNAFGGDEFMFYVVIVNALTIILVWFWSALFLVVDIYQWPKWFLQYKIQPGKNQPVDKAMMWKVVRQVLVNQFLVSLPLSVIYYSIGVHNGCTISPDDFPTLPRLLRDLVICVVVEELGFYYSHRLFHWAPLYKRYHKKHHEWTAPVALVSAYAHPLEHVFANIMPFALGPVISQAHFSTVCIWYVLGLTTTSFHHSGYHLPFAPSPEFHDYHHLKFNMNYGVSGWLDRLHGTDAEYRDTVNYKRHTTLLSLTSMRQLIPDHMHKTTTNGKQK